MTFPARFPAPEAARAPMGILEEWGNSNNNASMWGGHYQFPRLVSGLCTGMDRLSSGVE